MEVKNIDEFQFVFVMKRVVLGNSFVTCPMVRGMLGCIKKTIQTLIL